jgi:hypothetical protein
MTRIDRALASNPFVVDQTQCYLAGITLRHYSASGAHTPWGDAPRDAQLAFKVFFVAICHQINWDFLQTRMFERFFSADESSMIAAASSATPAYVSHMLDGYHRPDRIRAAERARYLRETASALQELKGLASVGCLVDRNRIFGPEGLMEKLQRIPAFSEDPLQKKANALAQELARERISQFSDECNIPPAIDYHLIRLYLRTGRVVAKSKDILPALTTGTTHRMRLVKLLRGAVSQGLVETAGHARLAVHELNYIEWQIARTRCEKDVINCDGPWPATLVDESISALSPTCPMRDSCIAYTSPEWRLLIEPDMKKAFY